MTEPRRPSVVDSIQTSDSFIRGAGREFLVTLYTAMRSLKIYPLENPVVQKALDDLSASVSGILDREQEPVIPGQVTDAERKPVNPEELEKMSAFKDFIESLDLDDFGRKQQ